MRSVVLSPQVCSRLSQRPQETDTPTLQTCVSWQLQAPVVQQCGAREHGAGGDRGAPRRTLQGCRALGGGEPLRRGVTRFGSHWKRRWLSDGKNGSPQEAVVVQAGEATGPEQGGGEQRDHREK